MSCHNIGYGLNNVGKTIFEKYKNGEISFNTTFELLKTVRDSVGFCDGNVDEALTFMENRCGCCLEEKNYFIKSYDIPEKYLYAENFLLENCWRNKILNGQICTDCLEKLYPKSH